jgi:flagellar motility protein MotE (MotC chaperone)
MLKHLKLLPITLVVILAAFGVHTSQTIERWSVSTPAFAAEKNAPPAKAAAPKNAAAPSGKASAPQAAAPGAKSAATNTPSTAPQSRSEVEFSNDLSTRRSQIEERARQIELRERLLEAAEKRVEVKIQELRAVEAQIRQLTLQTDKVQDERFASLVKLYETMKPKDAARIFEKLDIGVQIQVANRMKAAKLAPIMSSMDGEKARALTMELAEVASRKPGAALAAASAGQTAGQAAGQATPAPNTLK